MEKEFGVDTAVVFGVSNGEARDPVPFDNIEFGAAGDSEVAGGVSNALTAGCVGLESCCFLVCSLV